MVQKSDDSANTTDVTPLDGFSEDALREIVDFRSVADMAGGTGTNISDVLGTGFSILDDKSVLLNTEMIVVKYGVHKSEIGDKGEFATLHVVTADGGKWVVNDGSTGIYEQMAQLKEELGTVCPLYVPRGLRVSEYDYTDDNGKVKKAKTYYLNTAK